MVILSLAACILAKSRCVLRRLDADEGLVGLLLIALSDLLNIRGQ